jgi:Na+-translocating ferredoxin:NAD+ oxidoreductase RnfD subunit
MMNQSAEQVLLMRRDVPAAPPWVGSAHRRMAVDRHWLIVACVMLGSSVTFFGWRALLHVLVAVMASTAMHLLLLIVARPRRPQIEDMGLMSIWLGMMVGLSLPLTQDHTLPLLGGIAAGALMHVMGRSHRLRVHPLAVVMVLLWLLPPLMFWGEQAWVSRSALEPIDAVLRPSHVVRGDVFKLIGTENLEPWWRTSAAQLPDGMRRVSFADSLWKYRHELLTQRSWLVSMLSSGEMPRFEEMLLGAVPGPVGATSPALLLLLGIWLMYRRLAWWPMPLWALLGALMTLAWMPVPGVEAVPGAVSRHLVALGPAAGVTLAAYLLLASPLPLIVMIHAPLTMPLTPRGRAVYALILGSLAMATQWLLAIPEATYLALIVAGLLSRLLDNLHTSPFVR